MGSIFGRFKNCFFRASCFGYYSKGCLSATPSFSLLGLATLHHWIYLDGVSLEVTCPQFFFLAETGYLIEQQEAIAINNIVFSYKWSYLEGLLNPWSITYKFALIFCWVNNWKESKESWQNLFRGIWIKKPWWFARNISARQYFHETFQKLYYIDFELI